MIYWLVRTIRWSSYQLSDHRRCLSNGHWITHPYFLIFIRSQKWGSIFLVIELFPFFYIRLFLQTRIRFSKKLSQWNHVFLIKRKIKNYKYYANPLYSCKLRVGQANLLMFFSLRCAKQESDFFLQPQCKKKTDQQNIKKKKIDSTNVSLPALR